MSQIKKINTDLYECTEGVEDPKTGKVYQIEAKDLNYIHVVIQEGRPNEVLKNVSIEDQSGTDLGKADFKGWIPNPDKNPVISIIPLRTWESMQKDRQSTISGRTSGNMVSYSVGQNQYHLAHDPRKMNIETKKIADGAVQYVDTTVQASNDVSDMKQLLALLAQKEIDKEAEKIVESKPKVARKKAIPKAVAETTPENEVTPETSKK